MITCIESDLPPVLTADTSQMTSFSQELNVLLSFPLKGPYESGNRPGDAPAAVAATASAPSNL